MNEQELKDAISDMQECRELIGKANMKLNNILTQRKADMQKKLDDAYQKGLEEGKKQAKAQAHLDVCHDIEGVAQGNYQKGLDDAWDAAKKLAMMDTETSEDVTGYFGLFRIMENLTPGEAISKLRAYEEEKSKIHVGDEVRRISDGVKYVVVDPKNEFGRACGFSMNGIWYGELHDALRKTGRHFDIELILEGMQS